MNTIIVRTTRIRARRACIPSRAVQRGLVLVIALVILVAMSLAAIALTRSVDVGSLAAGNLSFKQSALSATDRGIAVAFNKFVTPSATCVGCGALTGVSANTDNADHAYFATNQPADAATGVPTALLNLATFDAAYPLAVVPLGSGETARYLIDRQCTRPGLPDQAFCNFSGTPVPTTGTYRGGRLGATVPLFRISVRVDGPKNTTSFTQVVMRP